MELKKRFSLRKVFIILYNVAFLAFLVIGFLPTEAIYAVDAKLEIPAIDLTTDVTKLKLQNNKLETPDLIAGSFTNNENKILLVGHSTTVFHNLAQISLGDEIFYAGKVYKVIAREMMEKAEISMREILRAEENETLVVMTCAGELYENQDASHRLIVTAIQL